MTAVPRGNAGAAIGITFTAIAFVTLIARLYTRICLVKNAGREEFATVFAWVFSLAHTILVCIEIQNGLGGTMENYSQEERTRILLPFFISVPMYSTSLCLSKVAILLLYMRLFPGKHFARACWATIIALGIFLAWACFSFMFMCQPVSLIWDKTLNGTCMDGRITYFVSSAFNIITDFVIFGLPLPTLAKLQIPRRQKTLLIVMFGLGLIGCLTSILRLQALYKLSVSNDYVYDILETAIWSCVESNVGFICACVPTLKPLVAAIMPHLVAEHGTATNKSGPQAHFGVHELKSRHPTHNAYAQFDLEGQNSSHEPGTVKVTTTVMQDVDDVGDDSSDASTKGLRM